MRRAALWLCRHLVTLGAYLTALGLVGTRLLSTVPRAALVPASSTPPRADYSPSPLEQAMADALAAQQGRIALHHVPTAHGTEVGAYWAGDEAKS